MKTRQIIYAVLFFCAVIFIVFNYIPSQMRLSGLEKEKQILEKLLDKEREIEQRLLRENSQIRAKLVALQVQSQKWTSAQVQDTQKQAAVKKKTSTNRGFLFKKK
jgi:DNA-directed RNA polymerase subunit E'/Rpb7